MTSSTLALERPTLSARWLGEPLLGFAGGVEHPDPKVGIPYAGPSSLGTAGHPAAIKVGFVGTGQGVDIVSRYFGEIADGVDGDETHHPFPGFRHDVGFRSDLRTDDTLARIVTTGEFRTVMERGKRQRPRFEQLLDVLDDRIRHLADLDAPPDVVLVVLPDDLAKRCRVAEYREEGSLVHRDLHAALKARCMRYRMPTQIVWESTTRMSDNFSRDLEHPADVAWNLSTAVYFKAGGFPWSPVGLEPGTCFVGLDFFRPQGDRSSVRASLAQAFAENGDAFVLRGSEFRPDNSRSPHLPADLAAELVAGVRAGYEAYYRRPPRHIVVHKRTFFDTQEQGGFEDALSDLTYDLVAVRPANDMRLLRNGEYPPQRGTLYTVGNRSYLYTTGTLAATGLYPHGHVPGPLHISDHVGDTPYDRLLLDLLLLTKMNWNTARYAERMPVTLEFADRVGDVLKEIGSDRTPASRYAFYM
jgi:hypothetical protein